MDALKDIDYSIFRIINENNSYFLDFIMYWISDKWIWIPLYIWLLYVLITFMKKKVIWFMLLVAGLITISDQVSVYIKFYFERLRPCHDPLLADTIHLVNNGCGGQFGFLSSHASNSMSLAFLLVAVLPAKYKAVKWMLVAYLLLVGYSRIYLGAHFPGDILGGWTLGVLVGAIGVVAWKKINSFQKAKS